MDKPLNVFISYARQDKPFCSSLLEFLKPMERDGEIVVWHDGEIVPGEEWDKEIKAHLGNAQILILLVSITFINSDYITRIELAEAMARHEIGSARVIPIIVRKCNWKKEIFSKLAALPMDETGNVLPVLEWETYDNAYQVIVDGIEKAVQSINKFSRNGHEKTHVIEREPGVSSDPENENFRFYGLHGILDGPTIQGFDIDRKSNHPKPNINPIQFLWADALFGNTISACIIKGNNVPNSLRVTFDHRRGWG